MNVGSKTPLAYTDMFYITTVYNKKKYQYIYHKGETKPMLESLLGYEEEEYEECDDNNINGDELLEELKIQKKKVAIGEDTEERNGTIIKIIIKHEDIQSFVTELKSQLAYFDSVYFKNWGISNDYDIYQGKYFKFRSDIDQSNTEIHICIEKVRYSIDFKQVEVPTRYKKIPIAVKFDIGELQVTPNREAIRYTPQAKELINQRIKLAAEEILDLYASNNPTIDDLDTYVKKQNEVPKIVMNAEKGHCLYIWAYSGLDKKFKFSPFNNLGINKIPDNMFFMWEIVGIINSGVSVPSNKLYKPPFDNNFIVSGDYIILNKEDRISEFTNIKVGRELSNGDVYLIRKIKLDIDKKRYNELLDKLGIKEDKKIGKAKTIKNYILKVEEIVKAKSKGNYQDYRADDEWIAAYRKEIIESSAAYIRKKNKKIFCRNYNGNDFYSTELLLGNIVSRTGPFIYGHKDDRDILKAIYILMYQNKSIVKAKSNKFKHALQIVQISKESEKDILGFNKDSSGRLVFNKNIIYCRDFIKTGYFKRLHTRIWMRQNFELHISNLNFKMKIIRGFKENYDRAKASFSSISNYSNEIPNYFRHINKIELVESLMKDYKYFFDNFTGKKDIELPLQRYITSIPIDSEDFILYRTLLKQAGIKLTNECYLKNTEQLYQEFRTSRFKEELSILLESFGKPAQNNLLIYQNLETNVNNENNNESYNSEED